MLEILPILSDSAAESPCSDCHAGCCRSFAVPVTGADILKLERDLSLTFWDVACRWEDAEGRIAQNYAPHFFFADEPETPFVICLLHHASHWFPATSKCRFLVEGEPDATHPFGIGHCGIYQHRPGTCRAFPATLNDTASLAVIGEIPAMGRDDSHPIYDLCPREWEASDYDSLTGLQELVIARFEMNFFQKIADAWNRLPQSWELFPEFLRLVYSGRVVKRTPIAVEGDLPQVIPFPGQRGDQPRTRVA